MDDVIRNLIETPIMYHSHSEFEVVRSTILFMDRKEYCSHYFNWYIEAETRLKLEKHGVVVEYGSDHSGSFTLVKWK